MGYKNISIEIKNNEAVLINVSREIIGVGSEDSMSEWILKVLTNNEILCKSFDLPSTKKLNKYFKEILSSDSSIKIPIINLLTNRINSSITIIQEICNNEFCSSGMNELENNVKELRNLIGHQSSSRSNKTISSVANALSINRLHLFKDNWNDTDLKIVLGTLHYCKKNTDSKKDLNRLFEFVLNQLLEEIYHPGHIPEPRHAWWSVTILATDADAEWLSIKINEIKKIIKYLLSKAEYSPRVDIVKKSIAPELHSEEYEKLCEALNICRVLLSKLPSLITNDIITQLKNKLTTHINVILSDKKEKSFKIVATKLILFYELQKLEQFEFYKTYSSNKKFNLAKHQLGSYFYSLDTIQKTNLLLKKGKEFLANQDLWTKHTLTSCLICGSPGQGKSEYIRQFEVELRNISKEFGKNLITISNTVGTEIKSQEDVNNIIKLYQLSRGEKKDTVFLIVFDEIDKSNFEFTTPFLSALEEPINNIDCPLTFWAFAQSSYYSMDNYKAYADTLSNKSLRDFLTRIQMGSIELIDLKFSPEQRLLSAIGIVKNTFPSGISISHSWANYFASNFKIENIRVLIKEINENTILKNNVIFLKNNYNSANNKSKNWGTKDIWIKI